MNDMSVILLGAGRYGNCLVGRKYIDKKFDARLTGVVDPKIDEIKNSPSYNLRGIPTYHSIEEIPRECAKDCVADVAIMPELVADAYKNLANIGVKKIILPKPVVTNDEEFKEILDVADAEHIETLVASNWHYAKITKMVKALINKLTGKPISSSEKLPKKFASMLNNFSSNYEIEKVEVEYNKKQETLAIDPPLQEMPHAIQIVNSIGCTDLSQINLVMDRANQSKSRVNVVIEDNKNVDDVISLNSDLVMGDKLDKDRERLLRVYLRNGSEKAIVTVDYDAKFAPNGQCIKTQNIRYESLNSPKNNWVYDVREDNIETMYGTMFDYFKGDKDNDALTIKKYSPIVGILCKMENIWKSIVK